MVALPPQPRDLAQIRFDNAVALFDDFVRATVKHPAAATLRGLDGRFAEQLLIQPSYWSQIKARSRQIGERLARQFEQRCHKPAGWLDEPHTPPAAPGLPMHPSTTTSASSSGSCSVATAATRSEPGRGCSSCSAKCCRHRRRPLLPQPRRSPAAATRSSGRRRAPLWRR